MKTKILIVSCFTIILLFSIACSKEAIEDCLVGSGVGCTQFPIPTEDEGLSDVNKIEMDAALIETDSTLAASKLPVRD